MENVLKGVEQYLQGFLQDVINETGICIDRIEIDCATNPITNNRVITKVKAVTYVETLAAAWDE